MSLSSPGNLTNKQRVFYQWLLDRMDRIGYEEIPDYYMSAWKTLEPMELPWGFIHEWHGYWRNFQVKRSNVESQTKATRHEPKTQALEDVPSLLCGLRGEALLRFLEVLPSIVGEDSELLAPMRIKVESITPVPLQDIPDPCSIDAGIAVITGTDAIKRKRLRTLLRLLHHPDHGGKGEVFTRIEEAFKSQDE